MPGEHYDIVVCGGGITGAGIARDAALRGLSTGLVEAVDFAAGTSSRSSKLIHGGVRYLAQGDVALVREAASERLVLKRIAPHLAVPVAMVIPTYARTTHLKLGAGLWAFEKLVQGRDLKACLGYLREAFADTKPDEVVFRSLAQIRNGYLKQLKAKRLLKTGMPQREIETRLRIFYDSAFFARAARVTEERLRRDLRRCLQVETDLKSKAWLDAKLELERLVVELCSRTLSPA